MHDKIYLDFYHDVNTTKRKCRCRYCKGIIIKGEKRVTNGFRNRFGWQRHHYHIYCTAQMFIDAERDIQKNIRKMLRYCGFVEDDESAFFHDLFSSPALGVA